MLPKIEIENTGNDILPQLLKAVHHYYPVGMVHQPESYSGTKELIQLTNKKIENDIPATDFLKSLSYSFGHLRAAEVRPNAFPRLAFNLVLGYDKTLYRQRLNQLHIKISKLAPFYTIFHQEDNMAMVANPAIPAPPSIQRLLSASHEEIDPGGKIVKQLKEKVESFFPAYSFVNPFVLFNNKLVGTVPYGVEGKISTEYNFYDLLFDNDMIELQGATVFQL